MTAQGYRSRRLLRLLGSKLSTRRTRSAPLIPSALAISSIVVREGLYLPRSRRLMYFGWYPLSKASTSWVMPRSSRRVIKTRAKARFSKYARSAVVPRRAIDPQIVAHISAWFHKVYYPRLEFGPYGVTNSGLALGRPPRGRISVGNGVASKALPFCATQTGLARKGAGPQAKRGREERAALCAPHHFLSKRSASHRLPASLKSAGLCIPPWEGSVYLCRIPSGPRHS